MRYLLLVILFAAACSSNPEPENTNRGPLLLGEFTLAPTLPAATLITSPTPTRPVPTSEILSPLEVFTLEADFVLVTPTLPPSKTPTETPTSPTSPPQTPSPTMTMTATATIPAFPTSVILPVTAPVAVPVQQVCDTVWFFIEPRPANCPLSEPISAQAVYQQFQNGYMVWFGAQDVIFVMYNDFVQPRWQIVPDAFEEGMVEDDPAYNDSPSEFTWQPRRGFGMLWRNDEAIRTRIGWAIDEWEQPYSAQTQIATDGTQFISTPDDGVFGLLPGGTDWTLYEGMATP